MTPTELRLGNRVTDINDFPYYVVGVFKDEVYLDFEGNQGDMFEEKYEDVKPILLTEEILLKCEGIKPVKNLILKNFHYKIDKNRFLNISDIGTPNGMIYLCYKEDGNITDLVRLYNWDFDKELYLHKFQNLIFTLTGEELNVKL